MRIMLWQLLILAAASLVSAQDYNIVTPDEGPTDTLEVPASTQTFQCYDTDMSTSYTMLLSVDVPKEMTAAAYMASHNSIYNGVVGLSRIDTPVSLSYSTAEMGTLCNGASSCSPRYDVLAYAVAGSKEVIGSASASFVPVGHPIAQNYYKALPCVDSNGNFKSAVLANYMVTTNFSMTMPLAGAVQIFSMTDDFQPIVQGVISQPVCASCLPGTTCCFAGPDYIEGSMSQSQPSALSIILQQVPLTTGVTPTWFPTGSTSQSSLSETSSESATPVSSAGSSGAGNPKTTPAAPPGLQPAASRSQVQSGGYRGGVSIIFLAVLAMGALFGTVICA